MNRGEHLIAECCREWAPPPALTLSEWAEKNFKLSSEYSAAGGKLVTLYKFQRGILDSFTDPYVVETDVMSATQMVKTFFQQAAIAYVIAVAPGPILAAQPTEGAAESFSKERLAPMLRDLPCLRGKVGEAKRGKGDNTILQKHFPGGSLTLIGAQTPDNFARRSIRYFFADERDKWPVAVGKEGDGYSLGVKRQATFRSLQKRIQTCSPTVTGNSQIADAYLLSDQRKFWIPCPVCGEFQILRWAQVRDPRFPGKQPSETMYECAHCQALWDDVTRWDACERGEWRADKPFKGTAGFWISELYSPWKKLSELADDYFAKKDNPAQFQTFVNTTLAETWDEPGETPPNYEVLMSRREETYRLGQVPRGVLFLTAGVDCQKTWLTGSVWGWGRNGQRWLVDRWRIEHGPFDAAAWKELAERLQQTYRHPSGADLVIVRMAVDSGFATNEVYQFARLHGASRVLAVDGRHKGPAAVMAPTQVEVTVGGRKIKHGVKLWPVNVSMLKSQLYASLLKERPEGDEYPAGWVHTPADIDQEFFEQLTAEQLKFKLVKGFKQAAWENTRSNHRNEALDEANYARAAAIVFGVERFDERRWSQLEAALGVTPSRVQVAAAESVDESSAAPVAPPAAAARPIVRRPAGPRVIGRML